MDTKTGSIFYAACFLYSDKMQCICSVPALQNKISVRRGLALRSAHFCPSLFPFARSVLFRLGK